MTALKIVFEKSQLKYAVVFVMSYLFRSPKELLNKCNKSLIKWTTINKPNQNLS